MIASHILKRHASAGLTSIALIGLMFSLIPRVANSAPEIMSQVPAASVARGEKEVLVMNFEIYAYKGDKIVDADGGNSEDIGVATIIRGNPMYPITTASKIGYDNASNPKSIWIDRNMNQRFTPGYTKETVVAAGEGDIDAPLKSTDLNGLKIVLSDINDNSRWHIGKDALYLDDGKYAHLADSEDTKITGDERFSQYENNNPLLVLYRSTGECVWGVAKGDIVGRKGTGGLLVKNIWNDDKDKSGKCITYMELQGNSYSTNPADQFELKIPYDDVLKIQAVKDAKTNANVTSATTEIKVTAGTLDGVANGDIITFVPTHGLSLVFEVGKVNTNYNTMEVFYDSGGNTIIDLESVSITEESSVLGTPRFTARLHDPSENIVYVDENNNGLRDNSESIYSDENNLDKIVDLGDIRLTTVVSEKRLYKGEGNDDSKRYSLVNTASMAEPKWYSQTVNWAEGDDIIMDNDKDGWYNLDELESISVMNDGTLPANGIDKVKLWTEENGIENFQGTYSNDQSDLYVGEMTYNAAKNDWELGGISQPLDDLQKFYITADVANDAKDNATLMFAVDKNAIATSHRTLPDAFARNQWAQTVSAAAKIPPIQQTDKPSAVFSTITADKEEVVANGSDSARITIIIRDTSNKLMANQEVVVNRLRFGENTVLQTIKKNTDALGKAIFDVNSEEVSVFRYRANVEDVFIGNVTIKFVAKSSEGPIETGPLQEGDLFMTKGMPAGATVYYYANGKKNPFPNERVYLSWYPNFESVTIKKIDAAEVGMVPWGAVVRYRPGTRMVKVPDDPKVYAITPGGKACWVKDENIAAKFYGSSWNKKIDDLLASLFVGVYSPDSSCDLTLDSKYPTGTILYSGGGGWYVQGNQVRQIPDEAWSTNRFRREFAIEVNDISNYAAGAPVGAVEFAKVIE